MRHSRFGPSSLNRRFLCPGSAWVDFGNDDIDSESSKEGTAKHKFVAEILSQKESCFIDKDDEQFCVQYAIDIENTGTFSIRGIEAEFDLGFIHDQMKEEVGNVDFFLCNPFGAGHVFDWKFGHGDIDPAGMNLQLAAYAIAVAKKYELSEVTVHLVLAAKGFVSVARWTAEDLESIEANLRGIIERGLKGQGDYVPSKTACQYCKALITCSAVKCWENQINKIPDIQSLSAEDLGTYLTMSEVIDKKIGKAKQTAYAMLKNGAIIPGWHLAPGRSSRVWAKEDKAIAEALGVEVNMLLSKPELISVAEAEKKFGKKKVTTELYSKIAGKETLKPITNGNEDE